LRARNFWKKPFRRRLDETAEFYTDNELLGLGPRKRSGKLSNWCIKL